MLLDKRYLGDGVYVQSAGYGTAIIVTTENGVSVTNSIVLDERILRALNTYVNQYEEQLMKEQGEA